MATQLIDFWPETSAQREVLGTQAQSQPTEVFLAVHQPMRFEVKRVGSRVSKMRSEDELLEALLAPSPAEGTVIIPILGESGVGKSHAVRWLWEQIGSQGRRDLHTVWVPRGESLRETLRRVLAAFEGMPQYGELAEALDTANELTPRQIRSRLREALVDQLRHPSDELHQRIGADLFEFAEDYGEHLGALLQDPESGWVFFESDDYEAAGGRGALTRLTRHVMEAFSQEDDRGEVDRKFVDQDLRMPPKLDPQMGGLARMCAGQLRNAEFREPSIALLNHVLDEAKRQSLDLGGLDLLGLFKRFRGELHAQGRELVLLIEDFTVMAGLQGQLYDIMVQTPQADGEPICVLRTAFALTPGFMQGKDLPENVRTRAGAEWHVSGGKSDKAVLSTSVDLAAAYLNAARAGLERLSNDGPTIQVEPDENFPEKAHAQLSSFGRSSKGQWLFPFNRESIRELMERQMPDAGFNPRLLLRNVIQPVLEQRKLFEQGKFPHQGTGRGPSAVVGAELQRRVSASDLPRALEIVGTWGGNPRSWEAVENVSSGIFDALNLPDLAKIGTVLPPEDDTGEPPDLPPPDDSTRIAQPAEFPELEAWRENGTRPPQGLSTTLRKQIAGLVVSQIPPGWPGLPRYAVDNLQQLVFIPNMRSGVASSEAAFVSLGEESHLKDRTRMIQMERECSALLRLDESNGQLDYPGARKDVPVLSALATRLLPQAYSWLRGRPLDRKKNRNPTQALISAHLFAGALRGQTVNTKRLDRVRALFPHFEASRTGVSEWDALQQALTESFDSNAGPLASDLFRTQCAFQGSTGNTPYAFDIAGAWEALADADPAAEAPFETDSPLLRPWRTIQARLAAVEQLVLTSQVAAGALLIWTGRLANGDLLGSIEELAKEAISAGRVTESATKVLSLVGELRDLDTPIARNAEYITAIKTPLRSEHLGALTRVNWGGFRVAIEFQTAVEEMITPLESDVVPVAEALSQDDPVAQAEALLGEPLNLIETALREGTQDE
jgi:hypothetical protein